MTTGATDRSWRIARRSNRRASPNGLVVEEGSMMRLIQDAADQDLIWRQPSACHERYELRAGNEVLATLPSQRSRL